VKKSLVRLVIGLLIGCGFFYFAQRRIDLPKVWKLLSSCDPYLFAALCANLTVVQLLRSERWLRTFSRSYELRRCTVYRAFLVGNAANSFLPGRLGDLIRAAMIRQGHAEIGFGLAVGTVVIEKLADLTVVMTLLFALIFTMSLPIWVKDTALTGLLILLSAIPVVLFAGWSHRALHRWETSVGQGAVGTGLRAVMRALKGFVDAFQFAANGHNIKWILFLSLLIWSLETMAVFLGIHSLGLDIPVAAAALTLVLLSFGTMLPAAPGFIGTYQWLTVAALGFFSVDETLAFAIGVLLNFSVIIINVGIGFMAFLLLRCDSVTDASLLELRTDSVPIAPPSHAAPTAPLY